MRGSGRNSPMFGDKVQLGNRNRIQACDVPFLTFPKKLNYSQLLARKYPRRQHCIMGWSQLQKTRSLDADPLYKGICLPRDAAVRLGLITNSATEDAINLSGLLEFRYTPFTDTSLHTRLMT
jgi:hypothetical protein